MCAEVSSAFGVDVRETDGHLGVQGGVDAVVAVVAAIRGASTTLYKATNDLRWQASDVVGESRGLTGRMRRPDPMPHGGRAI